MKTVTICGSMRFADSMQKKALELEINCGFNVLQCIYNPSDINLTAENIRALEAAHRRKIELSDAVYVLDIDGYIGDSVKREIEYALSIGKEVIYNSRFCRSAE